MRYHLIAMGGAVMHNLALALHDLGETVSGSDDEIFDPAKSRLLQAGILPESFGWFPDKITSDLDLIILGMHAKADNPELKRALELGLKVVSFPEFLFEKTREKTRVVIGGSHGKTTITSMIMHVLRYAGVDFDYMVGAQVEGFDRMVRFSNDASVAIFEGDEYLSSTLDPRPKFHWYRPHVAVLSGVAWDHINVFPRFDQYVDQFRIFSDLIEPDGRLIYFEGDEHLQAIGKGLRDDLTGIPYQAHPSSTSNGVSYLLQGEQAYPLQVFGEHNLQNIQAAHHVIRSLDIPDAVFYEAMTHFKGAAKRMQLLGSNEHSAVYLDFAHSPSKLKATVKALREQFPERKLVACMELHTYSSLNREFLSEYKGSMEPAQEALVFFDRSVLALKRLPDISKEEVKDAFASEVNVMNDATEIRAYLESLQLDNTNLLLMSSGNFSGIRFDELAHQLLNR